MKSWEWAADTLLTVGSVCANSDTRPGQHVFNELFKVRPDIADAIRNTDADPFYENGNIDRFFEEVHRLW